MDGIEYIDGACTLRMMEWAESKGPRDTLVYQARLVHWHQTKGKKFVKTSFDHTIRKMISNAVSRTGVERFREEHFKHLGKGFYSGNPLYRDRSGQPIDLSQVVALDLSIEEVMEEDELFYELFQHFSYAGELAMMTRAKLRRVNGFFGAVDSVDSRLREMGLCLGKKILYIPPEER